MDLTPYPGPDYELSMTRVPVFGHPKVDLWELDKSNIQQFIFTTTPALWEYKVGEMLTYKGNPIGVITEVNFIGTEIEFYVQPYT